MPRSAIASWLTRRAQTRKAPTMPKQARTHDIAKGPNLWLAPDDRWRARQPWRAGKMRTFERQAQAKAFIRLSEVTRSEGRSTDPDAIAKAAITGQAVDDTTPAPAGMTMAKVWQHYSELRTDW